MLVALQLPVTAGLEQSPQPRVSSMPSPAACLFGKLVGHGTSPACSMHSLNAPSDFGTHWFAQFGAPFKLLVCALPHWALAERLSDTDCTSQVGCDFTMPVHVQTAGDAIGASTVSAAELYAIGQSAFRLAGS